MVKPVGGENGKMLKPAWPEIDTNGKTAKPKSTPEWETDEGEMQSR